MSSDMNRCVDLLDSDDSDHNNNSDSDEMEVWQGHCIQHHPFDRAAADQEEDIEPVGAEISADVVDMLLDDDDDDDDDDADRHCSSADDSVEIVEVGIANTTMDVRGNEINGADTTAAATTTTTTTSEVNTTASRKQAPGKPQSALTTSSVKGGKKMRAKAPAEVRSTAAGTAAAVGQTNAPNKNQANIRKRKRGGTPKKQTIVNFDKKEHDIAESRAADSTKPSSVEATGATERKKRSRRKRARKRTDAITDATAAATSGDAPAASNENKKNEGNKNALSREGRVERILARNERWRQTENPQKQFILSQKREKLMRSRLVSLSTSIHAMEQLDNSCSSGADREKRKQEGKHERGRLKKLKRNLEIEQQRQQQLKLEIMAREHRNANHATATDDDDNINCDIKLENHDQEDKNNVKVEEDVRQITNKNAFINYDFQLENDDQEVSNNVKLEEDVREVTNENASGTVVDNHQNSPDDNTINCDIQLENRDQEVNNNVKVEEDVREITNENARETVLDNHQKSPGKAIAELLEFNFGKGTSASETVFDNHQDSSGKAIAELLIFNSGKGTTASQTHSMSSADYDDRSSPEKMKQEELISRRAAASKSLANATPHINTTAANDNCKVHDSQSTARECHVNFAPSVSMRTEQEMNRNSMQQSVPPKPGPVTGKTDANLPDSIRSIPPDVTVNASRANMSPREALLATPGKRDGTPHKDPTRANQGSQPQCKPQPAIEPPAEATKFSTPFKAKATSLPAKKLNSPQIAKNEVVNLIDSDSEEKTAAKASQMKLPKNEHANGGSSGNLKAPPPINSFGISREIKKEKLSQSHNNTPQEKGKRSNKCVPKPKARPSTPASDKKKEANVDACRNFIMLEDSSDDDSDIECFVLPSKKRKTEAARPTKPTVDSEQKGRGRSPTFACSAPTQRKKSVSAKNPLPNSFQSRSTFIGIPSSRFHDKNYSVGYSQEDAEKEQDRLFQETLKRLRSKGDSSHTNNAAYYQSASGFSKNQMLGMTNKAQVPVFSSPLVDIAKQYPDHWKWPHLYARLGLPANAGVSLVKKHYRKLALLYHPDKSSFKDSSARFMAITAAYKKLIS